MPTEVYEHTSHTGRGRPYRVPSYVRRGPEHSSRWKRLVAALKRRDNPPRSPEAVATERLGRESYTVAEQRKLGYKVPRGTKRVSRTFYRR